MMLNDFRLQPRFAGCELKKGIEFTEQIYDIKYLI